MNRKTLFLWGIGFLLSGLYFIFAPHFCPNAPVSICHFLILKHWFVLLASISRMCVFNVELSNLYLMTSRRMLLQFPPMVPAGRVVEGEGGCNLLQYVPSHYALIVTAVQGHGSELLVPFPFLLLITEPIHSFCFCQSSCNDLEHWNFDSYLWWYYLNLWICFLDAYISLRY